MSNTRFSRAVLVLALGALFSCNVWAQMKKRPAAKPRQPSCAALPGDAAAVTQAMQSWYAALAAEDFKGFRALIAPGFYMYDGGQRYENDEIVKWMVGAHADGSVYTWKVTQPDVHIGCDEAWIAYVNDGLVKRGETPERHVTWLESAVMRREGGVWKLVFFHSTTARSAAPPKAG